MPEALRIKGEVLLSSNRADTTFAEGHFRRSVEMAHRQGALSWELRTAISLAQLQRDHDCTGEARGLLISVYGGFTEGFDTADLRTAKALLASL
jgi:predicted ATPase